MNDVQETLYSEWTNGHRRILLAAHSGLALTDVEIYEAARVSRSTFYRYQQEDPAFVLALAGARRIGEANSINLALNVVFGQLRKAADTGEASGAVIEAAFRVAEAFDPGRWAKRTKAEITGANGDPIEFRTQLIPTAADLMRMAAASPDSEDAHGDGNP